ncbi:MAG: hypothetical protein KME17_31360 [Cyanosarcina radialis HA8281-LM2]|nr:hypothetical protein [Cyanosarcina radialis HA8281-LM2]
MSLSSIVSLAMSLGATYLYLNSSGDIKSLIGVLILPVSLISFLLLAPLPIKLVIFMLALVVNGKAIG